MHNIYIAFVVTPVLRSVVLKFKLQETSKMCRIKVYLQALIFIIVLVYFQNKCLVETAHIDLPKSVSRSDNTGE